MNDVMDKQKSKNKVQLTYNEYGKSKVRVSKIIRHSASHELKQLTVDISLQGDFESAYTQGDNSHIIATDSMKNTVYVLAAEDPITDIESFGKRVAMHFLDTYPQIENSVINIAQDLWQRMSEDGVDNPYSFIALGKEKRLASVFATRELISVDSGLEGLQVLKTTESGFEGFVQDKYTTLPPSKDRILATTISAQWTYAAEPADFNTCHHDVRRTILDVFSHHRSPSVQETLYAMGLAVLDARKEINEVCFTLPNQHHLPFNLQPFGLENRNEIFVPTDEPFGCITGTIQRVD